MRYLVLVTMAFGLVASFYGREQAIDSAVVHQHVSKKIS